MKEKDAYEGVYTLARRPGQLFATSEMLSIYKMAYRALSAC